MENDNELIAEFMGWVRYEPNASYNLPQWHKPDTKDLRKKGRFMGYPEQLKFHTSWDWLMPVVEKIEDLHKDGVSITIIRKFCRIQKHLSPHFHYEKIEDSKIIAVYNAVVEFIKWYNNDKQK